MAEAASITLRIDLVGYWLLVALRAEFTLQAEIWAMADQAHKETARDFAAARARLLARADGVKASDGGQG